MLARLLLVLFALALVACGGRYGRGTARGPDRRAMVRLERQAQREMNCAQPLHVVALDARAYQVDGCGHMREYAWTCAGRHCSFQPMVPALVRASEDLQCAPEQITAQADSATHRAFFGCMRGVAYALLCVDHGCTWSRTPETVTIAGAPAAPATTYGTPVADPSLADAVIPPPPGAAPPPTTTATVPPPPSSSTAPPTSDTVVVPPPPS